MEQIVEFESAAQPTSIFVNVRHIVAIVPKVDELGVYDVFVAGGLQLPVKSTAEDLRTLFAGRALVS